MQGQKESFRLELPRRDNHAAAVDLGGALGGAYRTFRRQQLMVVCSCNLATARDEFWKKENAPGSVSSPVEFSIMDMARGRDEQASSRP